MLLSQHAIIGAAIGLQTGNPWMGFAGGLVLHNLMDRLPHVDVNILHIENGTENTEYELGWKDYFVVAIDSLILFAVLFYIWNVTRQTNLIFLSALGGVLPDFIDNVPFWNKYFRKTGFGRLYHNFHESFHWRWQSPKKWHFALAICLQIVLLAGGIWVSLQGF